MSGDRSRYVMDYAGKSHYSDIREKKKVKAALFGSVSLLDNQSLENSVDGIYTNCWPISRHVCSFADNNKNRLFANILRNCFAVMNALNYALVFSL